MDHSEVYQEILDEVGTEAHPDSALQHIQHFLEGYRNFILGSRECPYPDGSARHRSYHRGELTAAKDMNHRRWRHAVEEDAQSHLGGSRKR